MTNFGDDTRVVHMIQAVCHPLNDSYNHWSLNIQFKNNSTDTSVAGSLRCHMAVDGNTGQSTYAVIAAAYAITNSTIFAIDFPPTNNLPVGYISQVIRNANLHKFRYSPDGSGCRHWIYLAIQALEGARYIASGSAARLWEYLHSFYDGAGNPRPSTLIHGIPYAS